MKSVCSKCGAVYELSECKTMFRDKDSLECNFCNETLMKWNGASFWVINKVIEKPSNPKYSIKEDTK